MKVKTIVAGLGTAIFALSTATTAGAAPASNQSPNQHEPIPVVCNGVNYTLYNVPTADHAQFTPAFVTGTNKVVLPFAFDTTHTATALTNGTVYNGVTYNAGDIIFSGTNSSSVGAKRPGGQTCTFGFEGIETLPDDNGTIVQVQFVFSGVAQALFPNSR